MYSRALLAAYTARHTLGATTLVTPDALEDLARLSEHHRFAQRHNFSAVGSR